MRTAEQIMEDRVSGLINSIDIKAAEELWQGKPLRAQPTWLSRAGGYQSHAEGSEESD